MASAPLALLEWAPLTSTLDLMIWKPFIPLGFLAATMFLPPRAKSWIVPICLTFVGGMVWGLLLVGLPLRKIFDVSEDHAVIALLAFTVAFMALFTGKLKKQLEGSAQ